jgi:hypothetical protein
MIWLALTFITMIICTQLSLLEQVNYPQLCFNDSNCKLAPIVCPPFNAVQTFYCDYPPVDGISLIWWCYSDGSITCYKQERNGLVNQTDQAYCYEMSSLSTWTVVTPNDCILHRATKVYFKFSYRASDWSIFGVLID